MVILAVLTGLKKKFALYSRSIGDFPDRTIKDKIFIKLVIRYLNKSMFNGLRDSESQRIADELKIKYYPAIDVVYSLQPSFKINDPVKEKLGKDYIIFTPSAFIWHPKFKEFTQERITGLYIEIIKTLLEKTNSKIVMLPHVYRNDSDKNYFNEIRDEVAADRIMVFQMSYDPDEYQAIIRDARFVIAARSHQVIFAINNNVPVICLSYEHKMKNMCAMLGINEYSVDLIELLKDKFSLNELRLIVDEMISSESYLDSKFKNAQEKAAKIAQQAFITFNELIS